MELVVEQFLAEPYSAGGNASGSASGAVGTIAVQVAKVLGAGRVIAAALPDERLARVKHVCRVFPLPLARAIAFVEFRDKRDSPSGQSTQSTRSPTEGTEPGVAGDVPFAVIAVLFRS